MGRLGKIARLAWETREQLNRRLADGEPGVRLVAWLNGLPEVRALLASQFGGEAINEVNLSNWRRRGFEEWGFRREIVGSAGKRAVAAKEGSQAVEGSTEEGPGGEGLADELSKVLTAQYTIALLESWNREPDARLERRLRLLGSVCDPVAGLRRGEHQRRRLELEREELTLRRRKGKSK